MRTILRTGAAAIALAIGLAACGGSDTGATPQRAVASARTGTLEIAFKDASPAGAAIARSRKLSRTRAYLSEGTASFSIVIDGGTPITLAPKDCSNDATGSALVCPAQGVTAPAGSDTIAVTAYDDQPSNQPGTGNVLGSGTITATITAGQTTPVSVSLDGQVANVVLALSNNAPATGLASTVSLTSVSTDAQGYTIIGAYAKPIAITSSDTTTETTLSKASLSGSADSIAVTYNGTGTSQVTFNGNVTSAYGSVSLDPGGAFPEIAVAGGGGSNCTVSIFNTTGSNTASDVTAAKNAGCYRIAISPNGEIVTDDYARDEFFEFAGYTSQSQPIAQLHGVSPELQSASGPAQPLFDSAGNLYINNGASIDVYAPPVFSSQYPTYTIVVPASVATAEGTLVTDASNNLWLVQESNFGGSSINEIANVAGASKVLRSIDYGSTVVNGASFGPSGELWVCGNDTIERFDLTTSMLGVPQAAITGSGAKGCMDLRVDRSGKVYARIETRPNEAVNTIVNVFAASANGAAMPVQTIDLGDFLNGGQNFDLQNAI